MWKFLRTLAWLVGIAAVLIAALRLTVIRWWQVPVGDPFLEASVSPSLRGGDWILLWRGSAPHAGDLVLCPEPKAPNRLTIGRIIGEKGDHVKLENGRLKIENRGMEADNGCDRFQVRDPNDGQEYEQGCQIETVAGKKHLRGEPMPSLASKPRDADETVAAGQVFLVSDNRQFPWDSREFGPVERSTCVETVVFRLVSKAGFFDVPNRLTLIR